MQVLQRYYNISS